jgi:carbonic anhydrase
MTTFDTLLARNREFAAQQFPKDLPLMPTLRAMIIGCVDPRVDPAHVFGLGPGEAIVIRNVGGRITPATLETMGMLGRIAQGEGGPPVGFHLVVLHHTHCGIAHLEGHPDQAFELLWYRPRRPLGQSGHRSARGGGGRCSYPQGDPHPAGQLAGFRTRL